MGDPATIETSDVFARVRATIRPALSDDALDLAVTPPHGDQSLNDWTISPDFLATTRVAAVLVGLVDRGDAVTIILTQRTGDLRDHAGQIAFPGGKMDPADVSPADTAIREAGEEIGLPDDCIEIIGYLDPYLTRTGFRIVPVVARITPPFDLVLNPAEVLEAFEVPFDYLMNVANHTLEQRQWLGKTRSFYAISHRERIIWGVTAGILRVLSESLQAP